MKLLFTGGGTLGSVTPLLALHEQIQSEKVFWIGTRHGIEKALIERAGVPFYAITAGKLRRYFDWRNFFTPIETALGFFQALFLLRKLRPTHVFSAGGYVAVPVVVAAAALGIPSYAMQLDVRPGLANRLIAPFVKKMFVVFPETARFFPAQKAIVTGAPVRRMIREAQNQKNTESLPTLFVLGGGTGALRMNEIVVATLPELTKICRVMHVTGKNKSFNGQIPPLPNYQAFDLLVDDFARHMITADLVITRAGMGTLSELAALAKATIVVPLPRSHQAENAALLASHDAAVILAQDALTPEKLVATVAMLLGDPGRRRALGEALQRCIPTDGAEKISQFIIHHS